MNAMLAWTAAALLFVGVAFSIAAQRVRSNGSTDGDREGRARRLSLAAAGVTFCGAVLIIVNIFV